MSQVNDTFQPRKTAKRYWRRRLAYGALQFIALFAFWLLLSGHYTFKFVVWGALAAGVVTFLTHDLLYSRETAAAEEKIRVRLVLKQGWHLLAYLVWLLWSIVKANLQVAYLVLHPRMPVDPVLLQFRTRLPRNLAQVIIGNSITLTPGTVTVDLKEGRYTVHALVPKTAQDVIQGRLQKKVAAIFLQEEEAPRVSFIYSIEELER